MLIAAVILAVLPGCQDAAKKSSSLNTQSPGTTVSDRETAAKAEPLPASGLEPAGLRDLDLGQNWDAGSRNRSVPATTSRSAATSTNSGLSRPAGSVVTSDEVTSGSVWMVVLGTFSGDNHQQAAQTMLREVRSMDPLFADAWVHKTARGAIVGFGRFDSAEDPAAQDALAKARGIQISGQPVFARAMLSRVSMSARAGQTHPYALISARRRHPNVDPLYSLDVAVWLADEAGTLKADEVRRRAEAYAQQLRAQGYEAYFHHDDDKQLSTVTVGLFDHRAIDPQTGFLSTDAEALRSRFPARLVNGEVLNVPIDSKRPNVGTEVQRPFLVLVPNE